MARPNRLSATFVKTANQPGRYGDGRGGVRAIVAREAVIEGRLCQVMESAAPGERSTDQYWIRFLSDSEPGRSTGGCVCKPAGRCSRR